MVAFQLTTGENSRPKACQQLAGAVTAGRRGAGVAANLISRGQQEVQGV